MEGVCEPEKLGTHSSNINPVDNLKIYSYFDRHQELIPCVFVPFFSEKKMDKIV